MTTSYAPGTSLAHERTLPAWANLMARLWQRWGIVLALLLLSGHAWVYRYFTVDDTYISFRFVRQFVAGNGLVFNIGERVEGYSNFLWVILLSLFAALGADLALAASALAVGCSLVTLWLAWRFAHHLGLPGLTPLLLAATASVAAWSSNGMETAFFTLLVTASAYRFVREEETQQGHWSGLLFALLALTRPEGLLLAAVAVLFRLWTLWRQRSWPVRQDWLRAAWVIGIVGSYFLWRLAYYGYLLPNTVYAKSLGGHPRTLLEGADYLYRSLLAVGGYAFIALPVGFIVANGRLSMATRYLAAVVVTQAAFLLIAGGDWMPLLRFLVHVLPLLYLLIETGLVAMQTRWLTPARHWLLPLLVSGQIAFLLMQSANARLFEVPGRIQPVNQMEEIVQYLQTQELGPEDSIAVVELGYLAYRLPLEQRFIDMVGLVDEHIAHLPPQLPNGLFGRNDAFGKWDPEYILAQEPRFIHVWQYGQDANGQWRTSFTGSTLLLNHPQFAQRYRQVGESGIMSHLFERID